MGDQDGRYEPTIAAACGQARGPAPPWATGTGAHGGSWGPHQLVDPIDPVDPDGGGSTFATHGIGAQSGSALDALPAALELCEETAGHSGGHTRHSATPAPAFESVDPVEPLACGKGQGGGGHTQNGSTVREAGPPVELVEPAEPGEPMEPISGQRGGQTTTALPA